MATKVWKDISLNQIYEYESLKTPQESLKYLSSTFQMDDSDRSLILLDFYYYNLKFCKEHRFSPETTSALFSILKSVHERCTESPFIRMEDDYKFFKQLLLQHSVDRPPYSQRLFTFAELKAITDYVTNTYFRHYTMYKYAFTVKPRLDVFLDVPQPEVPTPAALEEATKPEAPDGAPPSGTSEATGPAPSEAAAAAAAGAPSVDQAAPAAPQQPAKQEAAAAAPHPTPASAPAPQPPADADAPCAAVEDPPEPADAQPEIESIEKKYKMTPQQEAAAFELKALITATLADKIEELQSMMSSKLAVYDEQLTGQIKRTEQKDDDRGKKDLKAKTGKDKK